MLLTANQPMPAVTALRPAGNRLPQYPNAARAWTNCGTPSFGPQVDGIPTQTAPSADPRMTAIAVGQNPPPNTVIGMTPRNMVANSQLGEFQVQNRSSGRPCRSEAGMYSMPPGSTATTFAPYEPSRIGTSPGSWPPG